MLNMLGKMLKNTPKKARVSHLKGIDFRWLILKVSFKDAWK
ncbi:hypothetical protein HPSA_02060 [Helicobacter pylori SouthAfrica7]|uniref:Uncharacterized protein n=1 Tax=Helicobacter pylori (strain SouthAfrica7) TaxID=907239 RepID=E8QVF9_HELPW|nr:hypothetical protein HPSA_02060 [Helicobacter pylori SouthAfrica7]